MIEPIRKRLSLVDYFHFIYLLFLIFTSIVSVILHRTVATVGFMYLLMLALLIILVYLRRRIDNEKVYFWLYFLYPIIYLYIIFQSMNWLIPATNLPAISTDKFDSILYAIDLFFYDIHPVFWFERHARPLMTDIMYLFYSYYFFMPFVLICFLFIHKKYEAMERTYFILMFSFYMGYIGYMLVPARGPRFFLNIEPMQGIYIAHYVRDILDYLESNKYDIFPSMHQLISLVILILSYRYERKLFYFSLPIAIGITISLVYCQYHYVIDVAAGIFFAFLFYVSGNYLIEKYQSAFCNQFRIE